VLFVPISTDRNTRSTDSTCLLSPGSHEFIKAPSFVFYAGVRADDIGDLQRKLDQHLFKIKAPMDEAVLSQISMRLSESKRTPQWALKFFNAWQQSREQA
jgi:hypothetical protein